MGFVKYSEGEIVSVITEVELDESQKKISKDLAQEWIKKSNLTSDSSTCLNKDQGDECHSLN
jgi:hypothetical protein